MVTMPALDGVEHRYVDLGDGVTIHVADAGPADGPAVMLVHGFPRGIARSRAPKLKLWRGFSACRVRSASVAAGALTRRRW